MVMCRFFLRINSILPNLSEFTIDFYLIYHHYENVYEVTEIFFDNSNHLPNYETRVKFSNYAGMDFQET